MPLAQPTVVQPNQQPKPSAPTDELGSVIGRAAGLAGREQKFSDEANKELGAIQQTRSDTLSAFQKQLSELQKQAPQKPDVKPFEAPKQVDPTSVFGSLAGIFATIASFETKTPMTTALNALAGGMKAIKEGNLNAYQQAFQEWKVNSDYAFKMSDWENQHYLQNIELAKTNYGVAMDNLNAQANALKDKAALFTLQSQGIEGLGNLIAARQRLNIAGMEAQAKMEAQRQQMAMFEQLDPKTKTALATAIAHGAPTNNIVSGWGLIPNMIKLSLTKDAIAQLHKENPGMSDEEIGKLYGQNQIAYASGKSGTMQLTKMLGATHAAVSQLEFNADQVSQQLKQLPSTNLSPIFNAIARGEQRWTGNPLYTGLFFNMQAVLNESARIMSGGQASAAQIHEGARQEAEKFANMNITPKAWEHLSNQMRKEGMNRIENYQGAIKALSLVSTPESGSAVSTGAMGDKQTAYPGAPPIGTIEDGHRYIGGDPADESNWSPE